MSKLPKAFNFELLMDRIASLAEEKALNRHTIQNLAKGEGASAKLAAQIADLVFGKGKRMNTEQQLKAMTKLRDTDVINEAYSKLKATGVLREGSPVKRVYAFGSATTNKAKPSDLDVLLETKPGKVEEIHEKVAPLFGERLHAITTKAGEAKEGLTPESLLDLTSILDYAGEGTAKYGKKHKWIRLLGAATVGGGALAATQPDEAEASPAGVFEKAVVKGVEKASSSARRLVGQKLQGKTITNVLKGQGNWRKLLFDDGTQMIVEKQYIHDLSRAVGTRQYVSRFKEKGSEAQTVQALKSMKMHEAYAEANPQFTRQSIRDMHKRHLARVAEMGEDAVRQTAFVQRHDKFFQMPIEYAQHLEDLGILKIVRGKEEEKILKRFGVDVNRRRPELTPGGEENAIFTGRRKTESAWPRKSQGRRKEDTE